MVQLPTLFLKVSADMSVFCVFSIILDSLFFPNYKTTTVMRNVPYAYIHIFMYIIITILNLAQNPFLKSGGYYNCKGRINQDCDVQIAWMGVVIRCPHSFGCV